MRDYDKATVSLSFHISLNISDLARSVEFYRILFDRDPVKRFGDYAKFELETPPLVLSLEASALEIQRGALNHLGIRMADSYALAAYQRRLETAGVSTIGEDGVECCYARQTKFWAVDPDGNRWEFYRVEADLDRRGDNTPALTVIQ